MIPITIIIPFRFDSPERVRNLKFVCSWLRNANVHTIKVVEFDSVPRLDPAIIREFDLDYLFMSSKNLLWSRSRVINTALPTCETPVVGIWDTDVVVDPALISFGTAAILRKEADLFVPYNWFLHLSPEGTDKFIKGELPLNIPPASPYVGTRFENLSGGANLISTDTLRHVRGFSELFLGWGGEDAELSLKFIKLGFTSIRAVGNLIHLCHPRTINCVPESEHIILSQWELFRLSALTSDELKAYLGIQDKGQYTSLRIPDSTRMTKEEYDTAKAVFPNLALKPIAELDRFR